ncbi:MAG: 1-acyl-sn-glycerol-3-phosphate acyltransferase [Thiothrix sp.]
MPPLKRIYGFMVFIAALLFAPAIQSGLAHLFAGQNPLFLNAWAVLLAAAPFAIFAIVRYSRSGNTTLDWQAARQHSDLWLTIMGQGVFWAILLVLLALYPAFAKSSLGLEHIAAISVLLGFVAIGIFIGILIANHLSQTHVETGVAPIGAFGIVAGLLLFGFVPTVPLQAALLLGIGIMGGLFVAPMYTLLHYHIPDEQQLAKMLPLNDMVQMLVMLAFISVTAALASGRAGCAAPSDRVDRVTIAGALYTFYHLPQSLLRFVVSRFFHARYRLKVIGFEHLPARGGVLLLGNHISFIDWALVQMASPRQLHFVIEKGYYERWYLKGVLKWLGVVLISSSASADSLEKVTELLKAGEAVCLFPEGAISRTGQLGEFKRGYEKAVKDTDTVIVPALPARSVGSRFSRSSGFLQNRHSGFKTDIVVAFGKPLPQNIQAYELKQKSSTCHSHRGMPIPT